MARGWIVALVAGAALAGLASTPGEAGFDALKGRWQSEAIAVEGASACAPEAISVTVSGRANKPRIAVEAGPSVDLDLSD